MPIAFPDEYFNAIINGDAAIYTVPAGEWILSASQSLRITRHTLRELICTGSTFYPADDQPYPFSVYGGNITLYAGRRVGIATLDDVNIDRLQMLNVSGMNVEDVVLMRWGISPADIQEGQKNGYRTVVAIEGNTVIFDRPFEVVSPIYGSYEELIDASDSPENADPKAGIYGLCQIVPYEGMTEHYGVLNWRGANNTGWWQRGLGDTHDVWVFLEHARPLSDLVIRDVAIVCPESGISYANWQLSATFAQRISYLNCSVHNPINSACHFFQGSNCLLDGLTVTGRGRSTPFGGSASYPSALLTWWGGEDNTWKNITSTATDIRLSVSESGPTRPRVENVDIVSSETYPKDGELQHFMALGREWDLEYVNVKLRITPGSSTVFSAFSGRYTLTDLNIDTELMPDWFHVYAHDYKSSLVWNNQVFGPEEEFDWEFTLPGEDTFTHITRNVGIFKQVTCILDSRDGYSSVNAPPYGNILPINPPALEIPFPFGIVNPWRVIGINWTLADYYESTYIDFFKSAGADRTIRLTGIYLPARESNLGSVTPAMGYKRALSGFTQQRV